MPQICSAEFYDYNDNNHDNHDKQEVGKYDNSVGYNDDKEGDIAIATITMF